MINRMNQKDLSKLTDQELLQEAQKMRSAAIVNALFIGFLVGIVVFSILKNGFGFFMLIPLFFAYRLIKKPQYDLRELDDVLRKRNLK